MLLALAERIGTSAANSAWFGAAQFYGAPPPTLPPYVHDELSENGFSIVPGFLSARRTAAVLCDALENEDAARTAGVGTGGTRRRDSSLRRAKLLSLLSPPNFTGDLGARLAISRCMHSLCLELNGAVSILDARATELGYVYYPTGGFYERHCDVPARGSGVASDGGRREWSVLLYLDDMWKAEWGGALRIYPEDDAPSVDVLPEGGTLVLFRSDRIEHEVMETRRERHAVVGWLRSRPHRDADGDVRCISCADRNNRI